MPRRFSDDGHSIYSFMGRALVRCPRCGKCASVRGKLWEPGRLTCPFCALAQELGRFTFHVSTADIRIFDVPLWLQRSCCGQVLWALNWQHLAFIEGYVGATIRIHRGTRNGLSHNKSLGQRLPRWLLAAKNRGEVLRCIRKMKTTFGER
jgi:hypothetical protein